MLSEREHPVLGRITMPNVPFKSSEVDAIPRTPAPLMGQHNREILSTLLGYALAEVVDLERDGALYAEDAAGRLARDQPASKG
jgi:crotonobetainyl-CoA:carnitine CoA-transferase CaiB-like acyl-CoA transferase